MTATIISTSGQYPFGNMTNQTVASLISTATKMQRLQEAIATASSGYTGVEGTQFEIPASGTPTPGAPANLFGVVADVDPAKAGEQGAAYRYAVDGLAGAWATFWAAAAPFIEALDNGNTSM